jgi:transposase-like protein
MSLVRERYPAGYKVNAVKLSYILPHSVSEIARDWGISASLLAYGGKE